MIFRFCHAKTALSFIYQGLALVFQNNMNLLSHICCQFLKFLLIQHSPQFARLNYLSGVLVDKILLKISSAGVTGHSYTTPKLFKEVWKSLISSATLLATVRDLSFNEQLLLCSEIHGLSFLGSLLMLLKILITILVLFR